MIRHLIILIVTLMLLSVTSFAQSSKYVQHRMDTAPRIVTGVDDQPSFYEDFKARQTAINRLQQGAGAAPVDLIVENYDWLSNSYMPPQLFAYDFTGDGVYDPIGITTGNTLIQTPPSTYGRYAVVGFIDDFGVSTYLPYGLTGTGAPVRTGWNSHLFYNEANLDGKVYLAIYDFLRTPSAIKDFVFEIDLLTDPTVATKLTTEAGGLAGGWARFALDANGTFWELLDNASAIPLNLAISTDGGATFAVVDSLGSNDATFWGSAFGNDPVIISNGNNIAIMTNVTKLGSLAKLGLGTLGTTDPDSASGSYLWSSTDGGNVWQGDWILLEGDNVITNRPTYEPLFANYDVASHTIDKQGNIHVVQSGVNSVGLVGTDTLNVYPLLYWNNRDNDWMSLELPAVETAPYTSALTWGNVIGAGRPVVKVDASGNVVVVMWNRAQFEGEPGNSAINTYPGPGTAYYNYDVVYAYSTNGGLTFSTPEIIARSLGNSYMYPNIGGIQIANGEATVHYTYYWDKIPGSFILSQNAKSVDNVLIYNTVSFPYVGTPTADVTFQVDMGVQVQKGRFTIGDPVKVAGNFNGWNNGADLMTDVDGDTIYTITKTLNVGDTLAFKFIKGADGWENDPNRQYVVPATNSTYYDFFDRDNQYATPAIIDITFACNMELEIASGRFNPTTDTLSVRGSFNGWGATDLMFQSTTDPNVYDGTFSVNTFEGETINYKFAYFGPNGTTWENDPNKTYTVTAQDITLGAAFIERGFNNLTLANVTNFPVTIKFTVNMVGAISSINLQPFPSIDDVRICGANAPLQWPAGGWPNADSIRTIKLYDNATNGDITAGDNVWSRDVTFPQYSPLSIQYKYGANWGLASNNGGNDNENGVGADHFITLTPDLVSATVVNVFGTMGTHPLINIVTDVNEIKDLVPVVYELGQNYPNPFNPSTTIKFSIPESGIVTLRIFNMLGQEVATLLNSEKAAGVYEASFDASALSSGIYFYTLDSKNFSSTKKMVLLK